VFVTGCHRSGTNLLYDHLLSSGAFAVYRGYLPVHKVLIPRFGRLGRIQNRKKVLSVWLKSKGFRRSELDPEDLRRKILAECRNGGDFIRIHMDEIARRQNVGRWAVYDPDALVHMRTIKKEMPDTLFLHIVRDGRDVALSLKKMGGFKPFPWDRENRSLAETALYWRWVVEKGRKYGQEIPADYAEIHYEDLICNPRKALDELGRFLDEDLDYEKIQRAALGRLRESNSSFQEDAELMKHPVQRWKERLSGAEISELEALIGDSLQKFGYALTSPQPLRRIGHLGRVVRRLYPALLDTKVWLKTRTPLGRLANLSVLELEARPEEDLRTV
jgi:hypothetical protein